MLHNEVECPRTLWKTISSHLLSFIVLPLMHHHHHWPSKIASEKNFKSLSAIVIHAFHTPQWRRNTTEVRRRYGGWWTTKMKGEDERRRWKTKMNDVVEWRRWTVIWNGGWWTDGWDERPIMERDWDKERGKVIEGNQGTENKETTGRRTYEQEENRFLWEEKK